MGLELKGFVSLDGSGFEAGLHKIEHASHHVGETLKGLAISAFGIYGIEEALHKTAETAKELVNESKRLDVTIEQLQILKQAAIDGGTELGSVAKAFEKIDVARAKALSGSEEGQKLMAGFNRIGISESDLRSKTAANLFEGPISSAAKSRSVEDLGPIFKEIMGKGFGELMPVLKTDFDELGKHMKQLGTLMSTETAVKLKVVDEEFDLIGKILLNLLAPALVKFGEWVLQFLSHSKVVEGADFLARKAAGMAGLPDFTSANGNVYSAQERATAASSALDMIQKEMKNHAPFEDVKNGMRNNQMFSDFQGSSYRDLNKYMGGLINPVADVSNAAAKDAGADMNKFQSVVAELMEKIAKQIAAINTPHAPTFDTPSEAPKVRGNLKDTSDTLTRVGNFLGGSRDIMASIAERQVTLLQQIANNTRPSGGGGSDSFLLPPT